MTKKTIVVQGEIIIVSGCPRSGTSLCMDSHRNMYGDDIIMGSALIDNDADADFEKRQAEHLESIKHDGRKTVIAYLMSRAEERFPQRKIRRERRKERKAESVDMNPNGYWEHLQFSVNGIKYHPQHRDELQRALVEPKVLKVVSQGLMASDPVYIKRIVYMLRHPRAVAKSQERLQRRDIIGTDRQGQKYNLMEKAVIHTPQMFINVTLAAMRFFADNPNIPVKIIQYENLLTDPDTAIQSIYDFNGLEGDVEAGKATVDKSLNRSNHQDIENPLWDESEYIHAAMCKLETLFNSGAAHKEIVKIVDETMEYMGKIERENNRQNTKWFCLRSKKDVNATDCEMCMLHFEHRENLRKQSEKKVKEGIRDWVDEPCLFECGMDVKRTKYVSLQDSIFINWWRRPGAYPLEEKRAEK